MLIRALSYDSPLILTKFSVHLNGLYSKAIQVTALAECYMLGNCVLLLPSAECFFKINVLKNVSYRSTSRVSNSMDPDNACHF